MTRDRDRRRRRSVFSAVVLFGVLLLGVLAPGAMAARQERGDRGPYRDVLTEQTAAVKAATAGELSRYRMTVRLDPERGTVSGSERVTYRNTTGIRQAEVYFRLFPNAAYYDEGALTIERGRVDGQDIGTPQLLVGDTVLRVPLDEPLAPDEVAVIDLEFTTLVPLDTTGSFAILNRSTSTGTWALSDWYPSLAGYEDDRGWRIDAPTSFGDPTFAETALYDVSVTAPEDLRLVTTGRETDASSGDGLQTRRYVAGPVRDFTLVADDDYVALTTDVDGTTVSAFVNPGEEAGAQAALDVTATALEVYGKRFGPYPFRELDVVAAPLAGALGVSWSGIVVLDGPSMLGMMAQNNPAAFAFIVAHEIAHQWWGGQIGFNSNDHTFLLEGLTNYVAVLWVEATAGPEAAAATIAASLAAPYITLLQATGDQIADLPIAEGQSGRGAIFYGKAALGFLAIQEAIGDETFLAALDAFAAEFAFAIAEPDDLLDAFEAASGQELDELWRVWFEAAETTPADVEALIA